MSTDKSHRDRTMAGVIGDCVRNKSCGVTLLHDGTLESPSLDYEDNHDLVKLNEEAQLFSPSSPSKPEICVDYWQLLENLQKSLRLSEEENARSAEIGSRDLSSKKKLPLVLDLDHTLIHARESEKLPRKEIRLKKEKVDSLKGKHNGSLFNSRLKNGCLLIKLRPYVRTFLKEASAMFEMYIWTMATRNYAQEIVRLLDPEGKYFNNSRIISREDFSEIGKKTLDSVLGKQSDIIILDDSEDVWSTEHRKNLIVVKRYYYFNSKWTSKSHYETNTDESDGNGVLANVLKVLKTIHGLFFDEENQKDCKDVRELLGQVRSEVLQGCTLFFSGDCGSSLERCRAMEMGAKVTETLDSSVTHVVSSTTYGTENWRRARQEKRKMVHPMWIDAAYYLWRRQPKKEYSPISIILGSLRTTL